MLSAIFKTININGVDRYFELNTFSGFKEIYVDGYSLGQVYFNGSTWAITDELYSTYVVQLMDDYDICGHMFDWNLHDYLRFNMDWAAFDITEKRLIIAVKAEITINDFEVGLRVWLESERIKPIYKIELISLGGSEKKFFIN